MKGGIMADIYTQQADWLKSWQESQETLVKQYVGWGESLMSNMLGSNKNEPDSFKGWFKPQGDLEGQFKEFSQRLNEMVNSAWGDKIPAEMLKFMDISYFGEFYKNWLSSLELPEGMKTPFGMEDGWQQAADFIHSFLGKNIPYLPTFDNMNIKDQMNRVFGMLLGTLGKEESVLSDIMKGYQDFFSKMFESATAQSTEKLSEIFNTWAKEMEKQLLTPKMGIDRELAHDMSQLLVMSQDYVQAYHKFARLVEATGRKAGMRFQAKLSDAALENKPVHKFVDLCALWSVENETVFTEVMGTEEFAKLQGDFVNSGHRLKIHSNTLAERALEQTPLALKRDLDLAIAEITQLKRDMRTFQRVFRDKENETQMAREAQAAAEQELKTVKDAANAAQEEAKKAKDAADAAQNEAKKAKAAGAAVEKEAKRVKAENKTDKAVTETGTKTKARNV